MAERVRCAICLRERPTDADWDRNGELDDDQAATEGLDDLCWEEGRDDCLGEAIEQGRPTNYEAAMHALESLRSQVEAEVATLRAEAASGSLVTPATKLIEAWADRLSKLLSESPQVQEGAGS